MPEENKPAGQKPAGQQPPAQSPPAPQPRQGNSGQDSEPGEGLRAAMEAAYKARTEVPGRPGVDARLDNRSGVNAPPLEEWPAKPQQIDGPDLEHQAEFTRKFLEGREESVGERKGQFSPGPHGLSDESQRGGQAVEGREGWKD
jgi:hypothetical protein